MHTTIGGQYNATPPAYTDKELARLQQDQNGNLLTVNAGSVTPPIPPTVSAYTPTAIAASSAGDNTVVAGTANQTIRVFAIAITAPAGVPVDVAIKNGAGITLATFKGLGAMVLDPLGVNPRWALSAGNDLIINLSSAVAVSGTVWTTKS